MGLNVVYGETTEYVKYLKVLFSIISFLIFTSELFGDEHDVYGFYCTLLIQSSTLIINLLVSHIIIKKQTEIKKYCKNLVRLALYFSSGCFVIALTLLTVGNKITVVDKYLDGKYWGLTFILFPFIIYAFVIDIWLPSSTVLDNIKTEARP